MSSHSSILSNLLCFSLLVFEIAASFVPLDCVIKLVTLGLDESLSQRSNNYVMPYILFIPTTSQDSNGFAMNVYTRESVQWPVSY